jgi:hypothetical protein
MYLAINKHNRNEYHSFTWDENDNLLINWIAVNPNDWNIIEVFESKTPINQNNMTLEKTLETITNSPSSIFTKEDVLKMFNSLELPASEPHFTQAMADVIMDKITDVLDNIDSDSVIDFGSAEFGICQGNEVYLESCCASLDGVKGDLKRAINDLVEDEPTQTA